MKKAILTLWVTRIANPKFEKLDDQKIYRDFFVCDAYFADNCRSPGTKKLNRGSLPRLGLPEFVGGASSSLDQMHNGLQNSSNHVIVSQEDSTLLCTLSLSANVEQKELVPSGCKEELLDPLAEYTADLLFMDQLFDSVNGSCHIPVQGKTLRCAVTKTSPHVNFWNEALQILSSFVFECPSTKKRSVPPSVTHWIATLQGLKYLCGELHQECFKYVPMYEKTHWKIFLVVFEVMVFGMSILLVPHLQKLLNHFLLPILSLHIQLGRTVKMISDGALDTLLSFISMNETETASDVCLETSHVGLSEEEFHFHGTK